MGQTLFVVLFVFSSRRRHTRLQGDWSSDVCSSDLYRALDAAASARLMKASGDSFTTKTSSSIALWALRSMGPGKDAWTTRAACACRSAGPAFLSSPAKTWRIRSVVLLNGGNAA